ncbi:PREDICTED: basal body-orientation factor 1-like [Poecilia mexicana]|uniref:basal body-orientation factor 1-like n=1 Tax=Poecilia mexicana TaxID=48701 RepID=UPI00072E6728|nr:PREDICTED: basal body-orientation factor 1-like [Poecilia mexicana]
METKTASQGMDKNPKKKDHKIQVDEVTSRREMKLKATEKDLAYHQKEHYKLASETEELRNLLYQAEINEFGTTDYWQKDLKVKGEKIKSLEEQIKSLEELAIEERSEWENEKKQTFKEFEEEILKRKAIEIRIKKKIANMRKQIQVSKEEYRENLRKKDEEYVRLESETAERERNYIRNQEEMSKLMLDLKNTIVKSENELKDVHRKNNWLSRNLTCTLANLEDTRQLAQSMSKDKLSLAVDKKLLKATLKKNGSDIVRLQKLLTEVTAEAAYLEQAFLDLEKESTENENRNQVTIQASQVELEKLQKIIAMREKELCQVKKLARTIVEKRKDMEVFFHEALDNVRQEIAEERKRKVKEANQDCQKFRDGVAGRLKLPPIHTFHQCPKSTKSLYSDMKAAEKLPHLPSKEVYISDLTWEQKEKVLTLLFAKMNGDEEHVIYQKMDL